MSTSDGTVVGTTQVFGNAPRNRAFNVVLLAEGFRDTEQSAFNNTANDLVSALLATAPFNRLQRAINIFRVNVHSTDSGADNPDAGTTVNTYFDATFGSAGAAFDLQQFDRTNRGGSSGAGIHRLFAGGDLDELRRFGRQCRHVFARFGCNGDCDPRNGAHRLWACGRI